MLDLDPVPMVQKNPPLTDWRHEFKPYCDPLKGCTFAPREGYSQEWKDYQ